ncbi:MAG: MerR family transcriptional regulator [Jannaschia sp.]
MSWTPEKSEGAFRTIREVADWLGVPTHVLRFWESKFEQIAPVKGAGGRRYYRPEDMRLLGGIKVMLHDQGLTIRAVSQKIEDEGPEPVARLSPDLDMPEGPPPRTRRVIRHGDDEETAHVIPLDGKRPPPDGPAPTVAPERPANRRDGTGPTEETLPSQPDAPRRPIPDAPADDDAIEAAPNDGANRSAPVNTPASLLEAPSDDGQSEVASPAPEVLAPPNSPAVDPDAQDAEHDGDPEVVAPEEEPAPDPAPAAPASPETPPQARPVATDIPQRDAPSQNIPVLEALRLARASSGIDPTNRTRLRRVIRRYRALAEEIAEDLNDGARR